MLNRVIDHTNGADGGPPPRVLRHRARDQHIAEARLSPARERPGRVPFEAVSGTSCP